MEDKENLYLFGKCPKYEKYMTESNTRLKTTYLLEFDIIAHSGTNIEVEFIGKWSKFQLQVLRTDRQGGLGS